MAPKPLLAAIGLGVMCAAPAHRPAPPPDTLVGITVPSKVALVSPEQAGKIVALPVRNEDRVTRDTVLFQLNARLEQLEVERLEALARSDVFARRAKLTLEHAERQATRVRDLRDEQISSERDLQAHEHELALARLAVEQATLDQNQAENQLAQARERLAQRTVTSPFDGIVTARYKESGEAVEKFVPVVEVMDLDPLWVEFECPIQHQHLFRKGSQVLVAPARRPDDERIATVMLISSKATASSHSFTVRASVPNPDLDWQTGLKMTIDAATAAIPSKPK